MNTMVSLLIILFCMTASAFFSGIEAGMLALNRARLFHWVQNGIKPAKQLLAYLKDMQRFLATILVGNNLVNVALSTVSASLAHRLFESSPNGPLLETLWATVMAILMLYFCEFFPKLLFRSQPLRRTIQAGQIFHYAYTLLTPFTAVILLVTRFLVPPSKEDPERSFLMTGDNLKDAVRDPKQGLDITVFESLMIKRVLDLEDTTADRVMIALESVTKVREDTPLEACYNLTRLTGHTYLPVLSKEGGECIAIFDVMKGLAAEDGGETPRARLCNQQAYFVNSREPANHLLPIMRKNRCPLLLVREETTGKVVGLVTEASILKILTRRSIPGRGIA